jgi:GcrA cell cycle regulator
MRDLSPFDVKLKAAFRRAIDQAGGCVAVANMTRVDAGRISRYGSPTDPMMPPADIVLAVDKLAAEPICLRAMAEEWKCELVPFDAAVSDADVISTVAEFAGAAGDLSEVALRGAADGHLSPNDKASIRSGIEARKGHGPQSRGIHRAEGDHPGGVVMAFDWNDKNLETLRQLFRERYTASEIAEKLGDGLSRNAVCGKLSRLGLTRGLTVRHAREAPQPKPKASTVPVGSLAFKVIRSIKAKHNGTDAPDALYIVHDAADVVPLHISLLELTAETCRWPYGDGPFTFCGCQKISDGPYCYSHDFLSKPAPLERKARRAA